MRFNPHIRLPYAGSSGMWHSNKPWAASRRGFLRHMWVPLEAGSSSHFGDYPNPNLGAAILRGRQFRPHRITMRSRFNSNGACRMVFRRSVHTPGRTQIDDASVVQPAFSNLLVAGLNAKTQSWPVRLRYSQHSFRRASPTTCRSEDKRSLNFCAAGLRQFHHRSNRP